MSELGQDYDKGKIKFIELSPVRDIPELDFESDMSIDVLIKYKEDREND